MKTVQINTYELELLQKGYSEQVELNHNFNFKIQELEEENKELKTYIKNYQISKNKISSLKKYLLINKIFSPLSSQRLDKIITLVV